MMKKLLLASLLFLGSNSSLWAQAFEKGNIVVNAGIGGAIYGSSSEYVNTSTNEKIRDTGAAASYFIPITAEYALHDRWGAGLQFIPAFYADTVTKKTNSFAIGLFGAYHFLRHDRFEMYGRLGLGYGSLSHSEKKTDGTYSWTLGGMYFRPSVGMRTYFSKHIGMFADLAFGAYSFSAGEYNSPNGKIKLENGNLRLNLYGAEISTGLAFKF